MNKHDIAVAIEFARDFYDDPGMSEPERRAMVALNQAVATTQPTKRSIISTVLAAKKRWAASLQEQIRFFVWVDGSELATAIADRDTVILAGNSKTGEVRINGHLVGGGCSLGQGLAAIKIGPLRALAGRCEGLGIEVRRGGYVVVPTREDETRCAAIHFDDEGRVIAPSKTK